MALFWEFCRFELKFRFKSLSTYVYFLMYFLLGFLAIAAEDFISTGNGKQLLNGPYANTSLYGFFSFFGMIVMAGIFGPAILRDFQRDTVQLVFTKPISKIAYLGGRWVGSYLACLFAFSGMVFGEWLGTYAPWADHTRIVHGHGLWYWQPFALFPVVQTFVIGSLFFMVAALSRKIFVVYLQGIALFLVYLVFINVFNQTRSLEHFWSGILDPVGFQMLTNVTRYWTVAEKNSQLLHWNGLLLYNRLLWIGVGCLALAVTYWRFPLSAEALTSRAQGKRAARAAQQDQTEELAATRRSFAAARLPGVQQVFDRTLPWRQWISLTRVHVRNITHEISFWAILILITCFCLLSGYYAGRFSDQNVWPVTFLMLNSVEGNAQIFLYIVATLYAGELIWRERDTRFAGIHDALPMNETTDWWAKFSAVLFVEFWLLVIAMLCGVLMQTILGYFHYEFLEYFQELFLIVFPQVVGFTLIAFFVQTVVNNKFLGHAIVIAVFLAQNILFRFGLENTLLLPGQTPPYTYSDMNRYGHFAQAILWSLVYWTAIFAILGVLSVALTRRGAEDSLHHRLQGLRQRLPSLLPIAAVFAVIAIGSGAWYFYNTHVLNEFLTTKQQRDIQAGYERDFRKYRALPQPKVISVDAQVDLDPYHRGFSGSGHYVLENKTPQPITQIHITDQKQSISDVQFDRGFHRVSQTPRDLYAIYQLDQPLKPGDQLNMNFKVGYHARGFRDGNERAELAYSGTFFDSDYFPYIGYNEGIELDDPRRRRDEKLPPLPEMAPRGDAYWSRVNLFAPDSDWIRFHTVVSTPDDQIALAPGYPVHTWHENGRNFYEYSMADQPIQDFFNYISGRYNVRRENYKGVNIEIYSAPAHPYVVANIMASAKAGLDYYQANYSPFQFRQFRVIEFPRYRQFAQSFPNTIPFSEVWFMNRVRDPKKDIDDVYFVTAHELAHQWWGHQLIGGQVAGSNMMSESLAEYSALRVMGHRYGDGQMRKFLSHELDVYLRGRSNETRHEAPLSQVQREQYVWYQKGSMIFYALSDYIGEAQLNNALHNFLMARRYANANDKQDQPYPDTFAMEAALKQATPPELQYFLNDSFEKITLYDNKALAATSQKQPDGKYKVTVTVQGGKKYADGNGNETSAPMHDYIDVGVLTGKKGEEEALVMQKEWITGQPQTFSFVVDRQPSFAGIDPLNKLIDRNGDDNVTDLR